MHTEKNNYIFSLAWIFLHMCANSIDRHKVTHTLASYDMQIAYCNLFDFKIRRCYFFRQQQRKWSMIKTLIIKSLSKCICATKIQSWRAENSKIINKIRNRDEIKRNSISLCLIISVVLSSVTNWINDSNELNVTCYIWIWARDTKNFYSNGKRDV